MKAYIVYEYYNNGEEFEDQYEYCAICGVFLSFEEAKDAIDRIVSKFLDTKEDGEEYPRELTSDEIQDEIGDRLYERDDISNGKIFYTGKETFYEKKPLTRYYIKDYEIGKIYGM